MKPKLTPSDCQNHLQNLLESVATLALATLDDSGLPLVSSAPYLLDENAFYLYVSGLSPHTSQMLKNPRVGILITEPALAKSQVFALPRLSLSCQALEITSGKEPILEKMEKRHGKTVALLKTLPDFRLMKLVPDTGRLILGFGQAWLVQGLEVQSQITV